MRHYRTELLVGPIDPTSEVARLIKQTSQGKNRNDGKYQ